MVVILSSLITAVATLAAAFGVLRITGKRDDARQLANSRRRAYVVFLTALDVIRADANNPGATNFAAAARQVQVALPNVLITAAIGPPKPP